MGRGALGIEVNEVFGQTECNIVLGNCAQVLVPKPGSLGKALPGHVAAIVDETASRCPRAAVGNIAFRRPDPVMLLEYWRKPEATRDKFAGDWLLTGDLGRCDEDGYYWYMSRADDVITSAGYRIGPGEIEDALNGHPAVAMSAVIGVPDPVKTEAIHAFVVLRPGHAASPQLAEAIRESVRTRLARHECPREIEFVDALPLTRHRQDHAARAPPAARVRATLLGKSLGSRPCATGCRARNIGAEGYRRVTRTENRGRAAAPAPGDPLGRCRRASTSPWTRPRERADQRASSAMRCCAPRRSSSTSSATTTPRSAWSPSRLQVTKPTLYYYVRNKEEILFECVRLGLELLRSAIADAAASGGSAVDKLKAAMREYALIVTRDFGMCLIRVGEDPLAPAARKELRRLKAELDHEFRALIEQGIAEGSLAPCDPKLAAFTLAGALSWIGRWYDPNGPLGAEAVALREHGDPDERPVAAPRHAAIASAR